MLTKHRRVKFDTAGLAEGEFVVYPSTFTREPDSYGDVVAKGAFADTIREWQESGRSLPGLYGHRLDDPSMFVAHAITMGEDEHGWWVRGAFDLEDNPTAQQVYRLVKGGRIAELSFAFDVLDEGAVDLEDGRKVNELRRVKVYEFSFVPAGANPDTSVVAIKAPEPDDSDAIAQLAQLTQAIEAARAASENLKTSLDGLSRAIDAAKASGHTDAKPEEPDKAKGEEPRVNPSAAALSLQIDIAARACGQKGGVL